MRITSRSGPVLLSALRGLTLLGLVRGTHPVRNDRSRDRRHHRAEGLVALKNREIRERINALENPKNVL